MECKIVRIKSILNLCSYLVGLFIMYYRTHKKNIDVLFFVEHKDRELEIAVSLTKLLEAKGFNVGVASSVYHQIPTLLTAEPKVLITPFTGFGKGSVSELFYSVYGESITYINLNYEQFISSWKGSYKTSIHEFSKSKQIQFVWGKYFKDELIKNGVNGDNIFITGRPSLSLTSSQYSNLPRNNLEELYPSFRNMKVCFIALTDGLAFIGDEKIEFIVKNGGEREGLEAHVDYIKKNIASLFQEIVIEAEKNKNVMFVMRPHPSIPETAYFSLFNELGLNIPVNVLVTKDKNAFWWLAYSDWYITNYSTLCLEANILGVKSYLFEKHPNKNIESYWYTSSAIKIDSLSYALQCKSSDIQTEHSESNYFIDFNRNGLLETERQISFRVLDNKVLIKSSKLKVLFLNSRRMLGSIIRNIYAKMGFVPFGKLSKGLIKDHFTASDVVKLKGSINNEF